MLLNLAPIGETWICYMTRKGKTNVGQSDTTLTLLALPCTRVPFIDFICVLLDKIHCLLNYFMCHIILEYY